MPVYEIPSGNKLISFTDETGVSFKKNFVAGGVVEVSVDVNFATDVLVGQTSTPTSWGVGGTSTIISGGQAQVRSDAGSYSNPIFINQSESGLVSGNVVTISLDIADINGSTLEIYPSDIETPVIISTSGVITPFQMTLTSNGRFAIYAQDAGATVLINSCSITTVTADTQDDIATLVSILAGTVSPANPMPFNMTWATPIIAFDTVDMIYDGTGNLIDESTLEETKQSYNVANTNLNGYIESGLPAWIEPSNQTDIVNNAITQTAGVSRNSRLPLTEKFFRTEVTIDSQSTFQISHLIRMQGDADHVNIGLLNEGATTRIRLQPRVGDVGGATTDAIANVDITTPKKLIVTDDGTTVTAWLEADDTNKAATSVGLPADDFGVGFRLNGGGGAFKIDDLALKNPTPLAAQTIRLKNCDEPAGARLAETTTGLFLGETTTDSYLVES